MVLLVSASFAADLVDPADPGADRGSDPRSDAPAAPVWPGADPNAVVGGHQVKSGHYDDAVGVIYDAGSFEYVACTGTLIGPRLVLTAGHCSSAEVAREAPGMHISGVLVGSKDYAKALYQGNPEKAQRVDVKREIEYPSSQTSEDVTLLVLAEDADAEPRQLAMDCILRDYLDDGASAKIVGFGVSSEDGTDYNTKLNEVATTITDKNCDSTTINGIYAGCNASVSPGGEIAAGGDGHDACFGDSGGPLYLETERGEFLVGVTSRSLYGVDRNFPCRDGGIWARPDAIVGWIRDNAGKNDIAYPSCNLPPEPSAPDIQTRRNHPGTTAVAIADPDGDPAAATISVAEAPEHGTVDVSGATLTYTPADGFVGDDRFTVTVTDGGNGDEYTGAPVGVDLEIGVSVTHGCGCDTTDPAGGFEWLVLAAVLGKRRR